MGSAGVTLRGAASITSPTPDDGREAALDQFFSTVIKGGLEQRIAAAMTARVQMVLRGADAATWWREVKLLVVMAEADTIGQPPTFAKLRKAILALEAAEQALAELKDAPPSFALPEPDVRLWPLLVMHREALVAHAAGQRRGRKPETAWSEWASRALTLYERGYSKAVGQWQNRSPTPATRFLDALVAEVADVSRNRARPRRGAIRGWITAHGSSKGAGRRAPSE